MERQTTGLLLCVDFCKSSLTELNTGAQEARGGGTTSKLITIRKFFQITGGRKREKIQKTVTTK